MGHLSGAPAPAKGFIDCRADSYLACVRPTGKLVLCDVIRGAGQFSDVSVI